METSSGENIDKEETKINCNGEKDKATYNESKENDGWEGEEKQNMEKDKKERGRRRSPGKVSRKRSKTPVRVQEKAASRDSSESVEREEEMTYFSTMTDIERENFVRGKMGLKPNKPRSKENVAREPKGRKKDEEKQNTETIGKDEKERGRGKSVGRASRERSKSVERKKERPVSMDTSESLEREEEPTYFSKMTDIERQNFVRVKMEPNQLLHGAHEARGSQDRGHKRRSRSWTQGNENKPCAFETDPVVLSRREKQILYGKNTVDYAAYLKMVPKNERTSQMPRTPNIHKVLNR